MVKEPYKKDNPGQNVQFPDPLPIRCVRMCGIQIKSYSVRRTGREKTIGRWGPICVVFM